MIIMIIIYLQTLQCGVFASSCQSLSPKTNPINGFQWWLALVVDILQLNFNWNFPCINQYTKSLAKKWTLIGNNWNKCYMSSIATYLVLSLSFHLQKCCYYIFRNQFRIHSERSKSLKNDSCCSQNHINIPSIRHYLRG